MKKIFLVITLILLTAEGCTYGDKTDLLKENSELKAKFDRQTRLMDNQSKLEFCLNIAQGNYTNLWSANSTTNTDGTQRISSVNIRDWIETKLQDDRNNCFKEYPVTPASQIPDLKL